MDDDIMKKIVSITIIGILVFCSLGAGAISIKNPFKSSSVFEYDMVIIAPDVFSDEIQPLIDHKNDVGIETFLKTTKEIYDEYEGRDESEFVN
jgi:hypothetical protein